MKKWEKPKLIVLVRNKSEEAVLDACKLVTDGDPFNAVTSCFMTAIPCGPCSSAAES